MYCVNLNSQINQQVIQFQLFMELDFKNCMYANGITCLTHCARVKYTGSTNNLLNENRLVVHKLYM